MIKDTRPFEAYYDSGKKCFWIRNDRQQYIEVSSEVLRLKLRQAGLSSKVSKGKRLNQIDEFISDLITSWDVAYAGPVAGFQPGCIEQNGNRILVTSGPNLLHAEKGDWSTFRAFLQNLLGDEQLPYLYGWLKVALECLMSGVHRKGQCLVIAGPADCGKSFLQNRITTILGGRSSKPYLYMTGRTPFNREQHSAEHQMIEDEAAEIDAAGRKKLGSNIKVMCVNDVQICHGKHREGINLMPFWRLSMTTNDDPEDLQVVPSLRDSLIDKFILLKARDGKIPKDDDNFKDRVEAEMKHFAWFLMMEWEIPANLRSRRFGITHFHHPELIAMINEMEAENELLLWVETYVVSADKPLWKGPAQDLMAHLAFMTDNASKRLLTSASRTGKLLQRLAKIHPGCFKYERSKAGRFWEIKWTGAKEAESNVTPHDPARNGDTTGDTRISGDTSFSQVSPSELLDNKDVACPW